MRTFTQISWPQRCFIKHGTNKITIATKNQDIWIVGPSSKKKDQPSRYPALRLSTEGMDVENEKHSDFVPLTGILTHVLKYGHLKPSSPGRSRFLFLIIPGNPGVIEYYDRFMKVLYQCSEGQIPVWGVSHAGHVSVPVRDIAVEKAAYRACTLEGQIKHKIAFIQEHIPEDVKLILIGHSIGCYIIMRLLDHIGSHQVLRCFHLFPTIERMAESPKGQIATPLLKYLRWLGTLIVQMASYLSPHVQYRMILWYFKGRNVPDCIFNATMTLFDPFCVSNVMYMANLEMQQVDALDEDLVQKHLSKFSFYYGDDDHWCPKSYYFDMKKRFPHADIRLCNIGHDHAFVLESSDDMAKVVWKWIQPDIKKLTD